MKFSSSKTNKVAVAVAGAVVLTGALAACGSGNSTSDNPTGQAATFTNGIIPEAMNDMTALYGTVSNPNSTEIKLTGCEADIAGMCQIHEVIKKDGKETMQELANGLPIPANGSVQLKTGSYHIMLMNLKSKPAVGTSVPIKLRLSNGNINVTGTVEARVKEPVPSNSMNHDSASNGSGHGN
ncbi:MAG: copper chaperone PCu(A)C [Candidatus Nanopelagicales bacterium]